MMVTLMGVLVMLVVEAAGVCAALAYLHLRRKP